MRRVDEDLLERLTSFDEVAIACSFQKEESVLLDVVLAAVPQARVFTIDTGVLFEETYETWRAFEEHFDTRITGFDARGDWSATNCCSAAKVAALGRAVAGADCWVTGLRREQATTRAGAQAYGYDERFGLWKANPLVEWAESDVWEHVLTNGLPYNPLHDNGYASIGCAPCTQPGNGREGRWAGTEKTECGLHV